jgi:hypothetical protein
MNKRHFLPVALLIMTLATNASEPAGRAAISLAELAGKADLVALAQVRDTDYLTRREIPVSGSAYLKVLIPYKIDRQTELLEVYEKGLHENECYFPNRTVFEEGRRYLLFLVRDPQKPERYRGMEEGCALDVLVDQQNQYALRYPVTGVDLSDPLADFATGMNFADSYAVVDDEDLPPARREGMLAAGQIIAYEPPRASAGETGESSWKPVAETPGRQWLYTQGIPLSKVRDLIGAAALVD